MFTPAYDNVGSDAMTLDDHGKVNEHVEVETFHQNPRLSGADREHEQDRDKSALPVLK